MQKELILIYFSGCPTVKITLEVLDDLGLQYEKINQDNLEESSPYFKYTSPTILFGEEIVFGGLTSGGQGCSYGEFSRDKLKEGLQKLKE